MFNSQFTTSMAALITHQDIDLVLTQRAREKVDKYREGYAAPGMRHACLPAVVSTSGRIHGELFWLRFIPADRKTTRGGHGHRSFLASSLPRTTLGLLFSVFLLSPS